MPACEECNLLAGNECFETFDTKRNFIRTRHAEVHKRELTVSYELDELIHESDEAILQKIVQLRSKHRMQERLLHQHLYDLSEKEASDGEKGLRPKFFRFCSKCGEKVLSNVRPASAEAWESLVQCYKDRFCKKCKYQEHGERHRGPNYALFQAQREQRKLHPVGRGGYHPRKSK